MVITRNSLFKANPPCMTWRGGFALRVNTFPFVNLCHTVHNTISTHIEEVLQDFPIGFYKTGRRPLRQQQSESSPSITLCGKYFLSREDASDNTVSLKLAKFRKDEKRLFNDRYDVISTSRTQQESLDKIHYILHRIAKSASLTVSSKTVYPEKEQCQIQYTYSEKLAAESYPHASARILTLFSSGIEESIKICDLPCYFAGSDNPVSHDQLKVQVPLLLSGNIDSNHTLPYGEKYSTVFPTVRFLHLKFVDAGEGEDLKHMTCWITDEFEKDIGHEEVGGDPYVTYTISINHDLLDVFKIVYEQKFIDRGNDEFVSIPVDSREYIIFQLNTISSLSFGDYGVTYMANANGIELIPRCVDEVTQKTWGSSSLKEKVSNNIEEHSNVSSVCDSSELVVKDGSILEQIKCLLYGEILNDGNFSTSYQEVLMPRKNPLTFYLA
jgi:hypothetical protein